MPTPVEPWPPTRESGSSPLSSLVASVVPRYSATVTSHSHRAGLGVERHQPSVHRADVYLAARHRHAAVGGPAAQLGGAQTGAGSASSSRPVAGSSATTPLSGSETYMTPLATIGVAWKVAVTPLW